MSSLSIGTTRTVSNTFSSGATVEPSTQAARKRKFHDVQISATLEFPTPKTPKILTSKELIMKWHKPKSNSYPSYKLQLKHERIDFVKPRTVFGRLPDCDVQLALPSDPMNISRHHACVQKTLGDKGEIKYFLTDMRSKNGVFVNGEKLVAARSYRIKDGDVIVFGEQGGIGRGTEVMCNYKYHVMSLVQGMPPPTLLNANSTRGKQVKGVSSSGYHLERIKSLRAKLDEMAAQKDKHQQKSDALQEKIKELNDKGNEAAKLQEELAVALKHRSEEEKLRKALEKEVKCLQKQQEEHNKRITEEQEELKRLKTNQETVVDQTECCICFEPICNAQTLACTHSFCYLCWKKWKEQKRQGPTTVVHCPTCRSPVNAPPRDCVQLDKIIEVVLSTSMSKEAFEAFQLRCEKSRKVKKQDRESATVGALVDLT